MRTEVKKFAELMDIRINVKQEKYGGDTWKEASPQGLLNHLKEEVQELQDALNASNINNAMIEATDVANLAMMIVDVCGGLKGDVTIEQKETA